MKVIVAGSRTITDPSAISEAVHQSGFSIDEVVSGGARGVDLAGEYWAHARAIPVKQFLADCNKHGRSAGYLRNVEMAAYADALIAVWDGYSRGTKHMIDIARAKGLKVFVYTPTSLRP